MEMDGRSNITAGMSNIWTGNGPKVDRKWTGSEQKMFKIDENS